LIVYEFFYLILTVVNEFDEGNLNEKVENPEDIIDSCMENILERKGSKSSIVCFFWIFSHFLFIIFVYVAG
jgi:hypothetical protein